MCAAHDGIDGFFLGARRKPARIVNMVPVPRVNPHAVNRHVVSDDDLVLGRVDQHVTLAEVIIFP